MSDIGPPATENDTWGKHRHLVNVYERYLQATYDNLTLRGEQKVTRGEHRRFADLYDFYLEAIYCPKKSEPLGSGRWRLMRSVATEIRDREAVRILDCAAGTGFPAVDLAADRHGLTIHCTDGDQAMLEVLARRARCFGMPLWRFVPPQGNASLGYGSESLVLNWDALNAIHRSYDYVMCRGNSLAYADTWSGGEDAASLDQVEKYLSHIAAKVRPGGYLHVDAPWRIELGEQEYLSIEADGYSIWEKVTSERDCRQWDLSYKFRGDRTVTFRRFSSLLTIDVVQAMLDNLGFSDTEPLSLTAERPNFGVIIARREG